MANSGRKGVDYIVKLVAKFDTITASETVEEQDAAQSRLKELCDNYQGKATLQYAWDEDEAKGMAYSLYSIDAQGD